MMWRCGIVMNSHWRHRLNFVYIFIYSRECLNIIDGRFLVQSLMCKCDFFSVHLLRRWQEKLDPRLWKVTHHPAGRLIHPNMFHPPNTSPQLYPSAIVPWNSPTSSTTSLLLVRTLVDRFCKYETLSTVIDCILFCCVVLDECRVIWASYKRWERVVYYVQRGTGYTVGGQDREISKG